MSTPDYANPQNGLPIPLWNDTPPDWRPKSPDTGFRPSITPYLLPDHTAKGLVLVCPGGGYNGRAGHEGEPIARKFNELGFAAAVVAYRTAGECQTPLRDGPLRDVTRAVRMVRACTVGWRVPQNRIAVLGFSAGGNLVGTVGVHYQRGSVVEDSARDGFAQVSSRPDAVIPCYAVLTGRAPFTHAGTVENLSGGHVGWADFADIPSHITVDTPPMFLWHTMEDQGVPVENSLNVAEALRAKGVKFALHVFTRGRHGVGLADDDPETRVWPELAARWLEHTVFK